MDRDTGFRRTRTVTYGLAGASLAGIIAVGALAQHASDTTGSDGPSTSDSTSTSSDTSGSTTTTDSTDNSWPTVGRGSGGGAATSGGS